MNLKSLAAAIGLTAAFAAVSCNQRDVPQLPQASKPESSQAVAAQTISYPPKPDFKPDALFDRSACKEEKPSRTSWCGQMFGVMAQGPSYIEYPLNPIQAEDSFRVLDYDIWRYPYSQRAYTDFDVLPVNTGALDALGVQGVPADRKPYPSGTAATITLTPLRFEESPGKRLPQAVRVPFAVSIKILEASEIQKNQHFYTDPRAFWRAERENFVQKFYFDQSPILIGVYDDEATAKFAEHEIKRAIEQALYMRQAVYHEILDWAVWESKKREIDRDNGLLAPVARR